MKIVEDLMLFGPNRRSEKTLIELWLELEADEVRLLKAKSPGLQAQFISKLEACGLSLPKNHLLRSPLGDSPAANYSVLLAGTALALQQHAGHRVDHFSLVPQASENSICLTFEYEDCEVGDDAKELAFHLLSELEPEIRMDTPLIENYRDFEIHFENFMETAPGSVLPRDTQMIIDAAARLDVPCVKLEREPYAGVTGSFRIRPNGLLKLGHACRQQVIDGSFCISRNESLAPLLHDREAVYQALGALDVPLARQNPEFRNCISSKRAVRIAEQLGYPVVIKPRSIPRSAGDAGISLKLCNAAAVRAAAVQALQLARAVIIEAHVPGDTFKVIVSNGQLIAIVAIKNGVAVADVSAQAHRSIHDLGLRIADHFKSALMTLTLVSTDISCPLKQAGAVVNMDVAPALDSFLMPVAELPFSVMHEKAAEGLVRYLFPEPAESRIPLIAVTGTNGKTTICALVAKIMQTAGYVTGRAGTTGFFINDECLEFSDFSGGSGHHKVLESPSVTLAVLESARGAASGIGFMFDWCDVAVCTNVTPDHLHERGIDTVEQMAGLKLLIMQRARHAVVLNADDKLSAGMLPQLTGRKAWLVSARLSCHELMDRFGKETSFAVTETEGTSEWIVLYDNGQRIPVTAVDQIPLTFAGRVRYNVSNALQAVAACYQQGASIDAIASVLHGFEPDHDTSPGRLNFYHDLPFTVLLDYAHNEDSFQHLIDFVRSIPAEGRKIIAYSVVARLSDSEARNLAGQMAGEFDLYVCRNYPVLYGRKAPEIPALMKQGLIERGVSESCIFETSDEDYMERALEICLPGDLLVFCASTRNLHKEWEQITHYRGKESS